MARYIAFLRAINAGRDRSLKMETMRIIFESLGFTGVATFIASGNVVFDSSPESSQKLERKIEEKLREDWAMKFPLASEQWKN